MTEAQCMLEYVLIDYFEKPVLSTVLCMLTVILI